jgi:hypothetical protein
MLNGRNAYRAAVIISVVTALFLAWINLAVGIIGSEDNPANLMYCGVIAIGLFGALLAKFRPVGMARAMTAMALAHVLVGAITITGGLGSSGANWPQVIYVLNGFFGVMWLASAWLFYRAR